MSAFGNDTPKNEGPGSSTPRDNDVWNDIESLIDKYDHSSRHILENFPAYVRRRHLIRFLAHHDLFKKVIDLPGSIVECGVYRGSSFFTWTKLLEIFCPGDRQRKVFGFDSFVGLQGFNDKDGRLVEEAGKFVGGYNSGGVEGEMKSLTDITNKDNLLPNNERCKLIVGELQTSLPKFLEDNPGLRISLLHLDVDLYDPTLVALRYLYPLVVKGGLVVFDEYGMMPWEGESAAAEDYFKEIGIEPILRKLPYSSQPHGYMIK